jgi:hypothetical protein
MVLLVLVSLAAYTMVALLFKAAAGRTQPGQLVTVAVSVVAIAAAVMMIARGEWGGTWLGAAIALVAGGLFYTASIYRVKALKTTPVSLVFALTNLDLVISGAIALLIPAFGQPLTVWNLLAVLVAGGAIMLGARIGGIERISLHAFLALAILSISAFGFVLYTRLFPTALLFFILLDHLAGVLLNGRALRSARRSELVWGAGLGICMFVGFWSLLQALATSGAQVTLVLLALSMKTPLIALLAVPVFKERVTSYKLAAVGLATLALVFWELGAYI